MQCRCGPHANCSDKRLLGGAGKLPLHPTPPGRVMDTHTVTHTVTHTETHSLTHTHSHTHTVTHTHTDTHTHTHTHI